jgi:hypothetical protein
MTDREVACVYYVYEGECLKGKEGTFKKACQICKKYKPKKGGAAARNNLKKQKIAKIKERDIEDMMRDY